MYRENIDESGYEYKHFRLQNIHEMTNETNGKEIEDIKIYQIFKI